MIHCMWAWYSATPRSAAPLHVRRGSCHQSACHRWACASKTAAGRSPPARVRRFAVRVEKLPGDGQGCRLRAGCGHRLKGEAGRAANNAEFGIGRAATSSVVAVTLTSGSPMIEISIFADEVARDFEEQVDLCARAGPTASSCAEASGAAAFRTAPTRTWRGAGGTRAVRLPWRPSARRSASATLQRRRARDPPALVRPHVRAGHVFGTRIIRGFAFWTPDRKELPRRTWTRCSRHRRKLAPIAERAREQDVLFCLECEGSTCSGTCGRSRDHRGGLANDNLRVAWDCNNAASLGEHPLTDGYSLIATAWRTCT